MADEPWLIGKRRWHVWFGRREQAPDPDSSGITERIVEGQWLWVNIVPIGSQTFWAATQVDTPVTHRVWARWLGYVDATHVIFRDTAGPDRTVRREEFRIRRVSEDSGRKRYTMLEVELLGVL